MVKVGCARRNSVPERLVEILGCASIGTMGRGGRKVHKPGSVGIVAGRVSEKIVAAVCDEVREVVLGVVVAVMLNHTVLGNGVVVVLRISYQPEP